MDEEGLVASFSNAFTATLDGGDRPKSRLSGASISCYSFGLIELLCKKRYFTSSDQHHDIFQSDGFFWHVLKHYLSTLSSISSDILSDIVSGISSDILSGILSDIHSGTLYGTSSDILSGISFDTVSDILSAISSDILSGFLLGISSDSWLRCGGEHCRPVLAVEVRRGTLPAARS